MTDRPTVPHRLPTVSRDSASVTVSPRRGDGDTRQHTDCLPGKTKDTRAKKARRNGAVSCGHYVTVGQVIVRRGGRWTCLPCALTACVISHQHDGRGEDGAQ